MAFPARIARSLDVLRTQVNLAFPGRDKSSDGWLGDARHQATKSEHNPDKDGVVRALDITNDPAHGVNSRALAQSLLDSRDSRILYVISNAQIARSYEKEGTTPWKWSPYTGVNEHRQHCHISVVDDQKRYDDVREWAIKGGVVVTPQTPLTGVKLVQDSLNRIMKLSPPLIVDGNYGPMTRAAVSQLQIAAATVSAELAKLKT